MSDISRGVAARPERAHRLRRDVGAVGTLFFSVGIVIGSGWLFGALLASELAGPAALISWLIGAVAILILGLNSAELGGTYAVTGGAVRFPHFAFGSLIGFATGWFQFLVFVTTPPIETEAVLTYASAYIPALTHPGTVHAGAHATAALTPLGYAVAAAFMLVFATINALGIRSMSQVNKYVVWWKIAIPALTIVALLTVAFHPSNFTSGGFVPLGAQGIFVAVSTGGIVFAYSGFDGAISFGAESKVPGRNIPLAVIGSMVIGFLIYIGLQIAFVGALGPSAFSHGWSQLEFKNGTLGPFAALAGSVGLGWLAFLLFVDAIISPAGTGLLVMGSAPRSLFALSRNRYIPAIFGYLTARGVPLFAIAFTFVFGMFVFLPFPAWSELVKLVSSMGVITYGMAPLALGALRRQDPDRPRPFRLPMASLLAPAGFVVANELILFSGFEVVWKLMVFILVGFALLGISVATSPPERRPSLDWASAHWLWPWLAGLAVISYLSSFDVKTPDTIPLLNITGPRNFLPFGWDMLVTAIFSVAVYGLAMRLQLNPARTRAYVDEFREEASATPSSGA